MANALVAPNSRLPVANQDGSATNAWYQFFSQIPSQISSTIDVSAASYTDHPALDTIWTRGPVPNPPTVQSGLTLGDKFKAMGVFNFAEVWPFDAFYDCYAQLQAYALYCQLMALAMKSDQLENLLERSFVDLYLPRGRFYISQPLVVPELVRITGPGVIVRAPYVGAQSGGSLTPGTFYAVSSTTSGMYYPLVIITPRAHIGQLNLYTNGGTGSLYFRGSGVAIGKFWAADPGGAVTIGQAGSGYNVGDFIYSPSPQASPYAPCYIQVTSVNGGGGVTGASVYNGDRLSNGFFGTGVFGLPPNLQITQWTSANGFTVFDPLNPGYFLQGSTTGSGTGCTFLPTWTPDFFHGWYNYGRYTWAGPVQTDTLVEHINFTGGIPGVYSSTYGPTFGVMVAGLNGIIGEIEGIGGQAGVLFFTANDWRVGHLNIVEGSRGIVMFASGSIEIANCVLDTCGCAAQIDESGRIIMRGMVFFEQANLTGSVFPNSQGYALIVGLSSNSSHPNTHLDIDLTLVNMGGVPASTLTAFPNLVAEGITASTMTAALYLAYCVSSRIRLLVSNWDETGTVLTYLPVQGFVEFHSDVDPSVLIEGTIDAGPSGSGVFTGPACVTTYANPGCGVRVWDATVGGWAGPYGTYEMIGNGAPTNGTTGAGKAAPGSTYKDVATGLIYRNTNTIGSPTWTNP